MYFLNAYDRLIYSFYKLFNHKNINCITIKPKSKKYTTQNLFLNFFIPIKICEPSLFETLLILKEKRIYFEMYYKLIISINALRATVFWSAIDISEHFFPTKAIHLLDETSAYVYLQMLIVNKQKAYLINKLLIIRKQKNYSICNNNFISAFLFLRIEKKLRHTIYISNSTYFSNLVTTVTAKDIAFILSELTGIPTNNILNNSVSFKYLQIEKLLRKCNIGHKKAIYLFCRTIKRASIGFNVNIKLILSFIFTGSYGVGKLELAKALAFTIFGSEKELINIHMANFRPAYSFNFLLEADNLKEFILNIIRHKSFFILFIEEIEQTNILIMALFNKILQKGVLVDSFGRVFDVTKNIIIFTSNINAQKLNLLKMGTKISFKYALTYLSRKKLLVFSKTILKNVTEIIKLDVLTYKQFRKLVKYLLATFQINLLKKGFILVITQAVINYFIKKGTQAYKNINFLRRLIRKELENRIVHIILKNNRKNKLTLLAFISKIKHQICITQLF
jgi:ATP-dependent Clp protease ATP-binding subunit ClpC